MVRLNRSIKRYSGDFFLLILALIVLLSFLLIKPYISAIFASVILAYLFYPVYKYIGRFRVISNKNLRAFAVCILIILIILLPMVFIAQILIKESTQFYNNYIKADTLQLAGLFSENVNEFVREGIRGAIEYTTVGARKFIQSLPGKVLNFFIMMFLVFYLLKDGERIVERIKDFIPVQRDKQEKIIKEFSDLTYAVVFGTLLSAAAQGLTGAIGFYLLGISSPILWGIIMMILALLPLIGPAFVWLPVGLFQIFNGNLYSGLGVLVYGAVLISTLDNIIKPKIIGLKTKVHPAIVLIGLIGGLNLFGFVGIVLGPLVLSFLFILFRFIK